MRTFKALLFATVVAGCTGTGEVRYGAQATVTTPAMVEVEPGVQVVEDYDEPVFFSEGVYWRYNGGVWYRSPYANRAWVRVEAPPPRVRQIDRPERYVRYHRGSPGGNAEVRADQRAINRDNREIKQDSHELRHDQAELTRDREEIDRAVQRGDNAAADRAREKYKRDVDENNRDRSEFNKDTERKNEMEREKRRDQQKR